jgi:hypothetical protein
MNRELFDGRLEQIIQGFRDKGKSDPQELKAIKSSALLMAQDQAGESVLSYFEEQLTKTSPFGLNIPPQP